MPAKIPAFTARAATLTPPGIGKPVAGPTAQAFPGPKPRSRQAAGSRVATIDGRAPKRSNHAAVCGWRPRQASDAKR